MPVSDLTFVPSLNGEEIIQDLCGLIAEKLRSDCNLRQIDGYAGGYKAKVTIHLEAFGLDAATVDYEVSADETGPGQDGNPFEEPDVNLDVEMDVPVEADLSLVRERSNQTAPDFEMKPVITEDGPVALPGPRKYARRLKALALTADGQESVKGPYDTESLADEQYCLDLPQFIEACKSIGLHPVNQA